jgi:hypothetical protein
MADHSGLTMGAYRKFSDTLRENEFRGVTPPKPAKAAKADPIGAETFGGLGALGEAGPEVRNSAPPVLAPDRALAAWGEREAERAAIVELDGAIPREWAEGFARLDPDRPPKDVPPKRWLQFINDIGRFLDSPFCAVAAALGWTAFDLFGADRDRPFARIDYAGLLWLLNDNRLAMLAENTATIETRTGARQTYRLKPGAPGRVLAWELVDAELP